MRDISNVMALPPCLLWVNHKSFLRVEWEGSRLSGVEEYNHLRYLHVDTHIARGVRTLKLFHRGLLLLWEAAYSWWFAGTRISLLSPSISVMALYNIWSHWSSQGVWWSFVHDFRPWVPISALFSGPKLALLHTSHPIDIVDGDIVVQQRVQVTNLPLWPRFSMPRTRQGHPP